MTSMTRAQALEKLYAQYGIICAQIHENELSPNSESEYSNFLRGKQDGLWFAISVVMAIDSGDFDRR